MLAQTDLKARLRTETRLPRTLTDAPVARDDLRATAGGLTQAGSGLTARRRLRAGTIARQQPNGLRRASTRRVGERYFAGINLRAASKRHPN